MEQMDLLMRVSGTELLQNLPPPVRGLYLSVHYLSNTVSFKVVVNEHLIYNCLGRDRRQRKDVPSTLNVRKTGQST